MKNERASKILEMRQSPLSPYLNKLGKEINESPNIINSSRLVSILDLLVMDNDINFLLDNGK